MEIIDPADFLNANVIQDIMMMEKMKKIVQVIINK